MTLVRHLAAAVALGVLLVIISITISPFRDYQMAEVACYVVAVAGLTALVGLSGQISLGNGAFMAIGAYAAALLLLHLHWPLAVVLVAVAFQWPIHDRWLALLDEGYVLSIADDINRGRVLYRVEDVEAFGDRAHRADA